MSLKIKFYAVRFVVAIWPAVPVSVKGAIYRQHRSRIANRKSLIAH